MRIQWQRLTSTVAVGTALTLGTAVLAYGGSALVQDSEQRRDLGLRAHGSHHDGSGHQHRGEDGHLPAVNRNVELVSKLRLTNELGRVSDVSALNGFAYLGAYDEPECSTGGVWVVDIRDPQRPKKVSLIRSHEDTYTAEGVQALRVTTPKFTGDLLLFSNEVCQSGNTANGVGGMTIYDVSNPFAPKRLVEGFGDFSNAGKSQRKANMIHSVLAWDAGDRAYAVTVDDIEALDVDIFDITDPSRPKLVSETGLPHWPAAVSDGYGNENLFHDVEVRQFGRRWILMASYWDVGYVKLDVTDPANPVFLDDSDFGPTDPEFPGVGAPEGNAHQGNWTRDGQYFVATDEDFSPYRTSPLRITTGPHAGLYSSQPISGGGPATLLADKRLNGPTVYGGYGCPGSAPIPPRSSTLPGALAPGEEAILVLQRGPSGDPSAPEDACFPGEKAELGRAAGYDVVVIAARHLGSAAADDPPYCGAGGYPVEPIVSFCITHGALHALFRKMPAQYGTYDPALEPVRGAVGERVEVTATFDGWGYVRLLDAQTLANLDTYAVPESKEEQHAVGSGDLSVHEVDPDLARDDLMHSAYYAAGYRALKVVPDAGGARLEEVGAFIDEGGNNFWGVHPIADTRPGRQGTLVLLSDRDFGLYVVKYTGR
ncbi:MAG TPA: hypothetical protein VNB94_11815 [Mycobacteriales bacterium]|nr:hypothetical protein [Mycobacteriales bacterium]